MGLVDKKAYRKAFHFCDIIEAILKIGNGKRNISILLQKQALCLKIRVFPVRKLDFRITLLKCHNTIRSDKAENSIGGKQIDNAVISLADIQKLFFQAPVFSGNGKRVM